VQLLGSQPEAEFTMKLVQSATVTLVVTPLKGYVGLEKTGDTALREVMQAF
jgi:hypothetical protein